MNIIIDVLWIFAVILAIIVVIPSIIEFFSNFKKDTKKGMYSIVDAQGQDVAGLYSMEHMARKDFDNLKKIHKGLSLVVWVDEDSFRVLEEG